MLGLGQSRRHATKPTRIPVSGAPHPDRPACAPAARMKSCRFLPVIPHEWNHPRIDAGETISLAGRTNSSGRSAWLEPSEDRRRGNEDSAGPNDFVVGSGRARGWNDLARTATDRGPGRPRSVPRWVETPPDVSGKLISSWTGPSSQFGGSCRRPRPLPRPCHRHRRRRPRQPRRRRPHPEVQPRHHR